MRDLLSEPNAAIVFAMAYSMSAANQRARWGYESAADTRLIQARAEDEARACLDAWSRLMAGK